MYEKIALSMAACTIVVKMTKADWLDYKKWPKVAGGHCVISYFNNIYVTPQVSGE